MQKDRHQIICAPLNYFVSLVPIKGQLISKGNFGVLNFPKNELENFNFCPSLLGQNFFVRFLEELKKPNRPFEKN